MRHVKQQRQRRQVRPLTQLSRVQHVGRVRRLRHTSMSRSVGHKPNGSRKSRRRIGQAERTDSNNSMARTNGLSIRLHATVISSTDALTLSLTDALGTLAYEGKVGRSTRRALKACTIVHFTARLAEDLVGHAETLDRQVIAWAA